MELIQKQSNWEEFKINLRLKYPQLTDSDTDFNEGMKRKMMQRIEYKLGLTKQQLKERIAEL
jgi:uncharacterized protein YjbJ (UPF0337 family)